jgi:hypothetical protein
MKQKKMMRRGKAKLESGREGKRGEKERRRGGERGRMR